MTYESLPKQFLSSVRVLFDVLDIKKQGYIDFREIETKWNKENTDDLPAGVYPLQQSVTTTTIIYNNNNNDTNNIII